VESGVAEDSIIASRGRAVAVARSIGIWKRKKKDGSHVGEKGGSWSPHARDGKKNFGTDHSFTYSKNNIV
jgi:hypothetical protein